MSCGNCWEVNSVAEKTNVPEIRFAGFTDPWEQRKFSDLADRISIQSSDSDLPQVEYEDIIPGEGTLNKELRDKEGGKTGIKFYAGDVLYGKLRPYLMNYLYPQFNGVAVGDFWVLRAAECDSSFLYRLVQTGSFQRLANVSSGSKMPRADWNLISQSFFAVPANHAEQKAIAKSLADLDNLITLHQRKYDKLCAVKKSMLDKMFPKPGETEPEIRFAGFTDPWEQRKLGEIAPVTMGQSPNGACYTDNPNDVVLVQGNADLKDGWVSPRVWTTEITKTAKSGDLIMSVRAPVGAMGKTAYDVVLGRGVAGIVGNEFLFQALSKKEAEGYWSTVSAGSTFDSINGDELRSTPIDCPRSETECEAIGNCLSKVDYLITLHQRKLNLLKNTKKSLLDRMFV